MEFRVLGPLEVLDEGRPVQLPRRLSRALLAYLLLHLDEPVSPDRLVDGLWGIDAPRTARASLQNVVSQLRKALGPDRLRREPAGYVLRVDTDQFDLAHFEQLVSEARAVDDLRRADKLRAALALWRGPPLSDLSFEPFAQEAIRWLEETRLAVLEQRIETDLALGAHRELVGELDGLVAEHPLREGLRCQLMIALYRCGRQAEALAAYQDVYRALEELGIEPGDDLRQLQREILRQEPALRTIGDDDFRPGLGLALRGEARKPVSALVCGLVGAASLGRRIDPEASEHTLSSRFDEIRTVITRHGGTAERFGEEAILGIFGVPLVHEDDALRAVRAAEEIRAHSAPPADSEAHPPLLIGVSTGVVLASERLESGRLVAGSVVSDAADLERAAEPGEILLSDATWRLVRHAVEAQPSQLETEGDRVTTWYLDRVAVDAAPFPRHLDAPLIGRTAELHRLQEEFDHARETWAPRLVTVLGAAGIGKTRLVNEFVSRHRDDATVLTGRCIPYGAGMTLWPLSEMLRSRTEARVSAAGAFGELDARTRRIIRSALGLPDGSTTSEDETFRAFRTLFEALAREQPLVLVFEDIHWGEQGLLDLIEHVADRASSGAMLLLCVARLELLDLNPEWRDENANSTSLHLESLSEQQTRALLGNVPGTGSLTDAVLNDVARSAEGNALFAEQMLAMLQENPFTELLPTANPTIQAILAARLDRLGPGERTVLNTAAIVGKEFSAGPLQELLPNEARPTLNRHLEALARKELIRVDRAADAGGDALRFRHALVWDSTYRAVPKTQRAELHQRFGDWLEGTAGSRVVEHEEVIGYHLEQACRLLAELGPAGDKGTALARRAAEHLISSGHRALRRGDDPANANLLGRAASLLPPDDPARLQFIDLLGMSLQMIGQYEHADALLGEAIQLAAAQGDRGVESRARLQRWWSDFHLGRPAGSADEAERVALRAIPVLEALGDELYLAKAWSLRSVADGIRGRTADAEAACRQAINHASRSGEVILVADLTVSLAQAAEAGPTAVAEALRQCEDATERVQDPLCRAQTLTARSNLTAMCGRFDEARVLVAEAQAILEDLGLKSGAYGPGFALRRACIELRADDPVAAERELHPVCDRLLELGDKADKRSLGSVALMLAEATYRQGRQMDAQRFVDIAKTASIGDSPALEATSRSLQAKLLANQGELVLAERFAREAVGLLDATDLLNDRADRLADLAEVLQLGGQLDAAGPILEEALSLYERKVNIVSAAKTRASLEDARVAALS
jgi:DNA-binding SARP family transcriptional activator/tetratricopeptide (TPR) repeat protein